MTIIAPSILSADFFSLKKQLPGIEAQTGWLHVDVMDGSFVPNVSFGFPIIKALKKATKLFLDTHLMIDSPEKYFARFAESGSGLVCFHPETVKDPGKAVKEVKGLGCKVGLAVNNRVPVKGVFPFLGELDLVLVMGVEAGFGAQLFIEKNLAKVRLLRKRIDDEKLSALIEVDGGINAENGKQIIEAGADVLVMGSAVFGSGEPGQRILELKRAFGIK